MFKEVILEKLHNGTKVWSSQTQIVVIQTTKLTKHHQWLLMVTCLPTLLPLEQFVVDDHQVIIQDNQKFIQLDGNLLVKKWLPYDMLWV